MGMSLDEVIKGHIEEDCFLKIVSRDKRELFAEKLTYPHEFFAKIGGLPKHFTKHKKGRKFLILTKKLRNQEATTRINETIV